MKRLATISALGLLISLGLAAALPGQSRGRPQTFEGLITLPNNTTSAPRASFGGKVVSDATGQPLAGATVALSRHFENGIVALLSLEEPSPVFPPVVTDTEGRFSFQEIPAGSYELAVRMDGYLARNLGERTANRGTWLTFSAGQQVGDFSVGLTRSARVEGRILGRTGENLFGIPLRLLRPVSYEKVAEARSAADGSYRLEGFLPGSYLLVVGSPTALNGELAGSFATSITVPNADAQTLDMSLETTGAYSIRGKVVSPGADTPPKDASITITFPSFSGTINAAWGTWAAVDIPFQYNPEFGAFEVRNLLPGLYRIGASSGVGQDTTACGSEFVFVSDADVTADIALILRPCVR